MPALTRIYRSLFAIVLVGILGGNRPLVAQEPVDRRIGEATKQIMAAIQAKDFRRFASCLLKPPPESIIRQVQPGTPPYEQFFGAESEVYKAASAWSGDLSGVSVDAEAFVVIAERPSAFGGDSPNVLDCVRLKKENGQWRYDKLYVAQKAKVNGPTYTELPPNSQEYIKLNQIAAEILTAFQRKDLKAIIERSVQEGPWSLRSKSDEPAAKRLFSKSQLETVAQWQGRNGKVYLTQKAIVPFTQQGRKGLCLQLILVDGKWKLDDITKSAE